MIFQEDMIPLVLAGTKTQTRRRAMDGLCECRYQIGRTYSIQPGRGERGVGRIRVLATSLVPVVAITEAEALAEGFPDREAFLTRWRELHGPRSTEAAGLHAPLTANGDLCWRIVFEVA